jgi:phosphatidylglycerophosphate synthase
MTTQPMQEVDSKPGSIAELRRICQGPRLKDLQTSWYYRHVLRSLSIYVTRAVILTPLTANQVTVLSGVAGVLAALLLSLGQYWCSVAGAGLILLMELLDHVDGEVARYTGTASTKGKLLWDAWVHYLVRPILLVGVTLGVYRTSQNVSVFVVGYAAVLGQALLPLVGVARSELLRASAAKTQHTLGSSAPRRTARVMRLLERLYTLSHQPMRWIPILTMGIQVGAVLNLLPLVLCGFAVIMPAEIAYQLVRIYADFE